MTVAHSASDPGGADGRSHSPSRLTLIILFGLILVYLAARPEAIDHDSAQYLQCGKLILDGRVPLVDIYDTNPPLIMYLCALPAALAELSHVPSAWVFHGCVLLVLIWSTCSLRVQAVGPREYITEQEGGAMVVGWVLVSMYALLVDAFGQRDHLLTLLVVPFLWHRCAVWLGCPPTGFFSRRRGAVRALAAGLGLCLKPQFLAVLVLFEVAAAIRFKRVKTLFDPVAAAILAPPLLYLIWIFWGLSSIQRDTFFHWILPLVAAGYRAYDAPLGWILGKFDVWFCILAGALPLLFTFSANRGLDRLCGMLGTFSLASVALYLLQSKGWSYQLLPAIGTAGLIAVAFATRMPVRFRDDPEPRGSDLVLRLTRLRFRTLLLVTSPVLVLAVGWWRATERDSPIELAARAAIERYSLPGEPVLICSTSVADCYPLLLQVDRPPASRYLELWPVPGFIMGEAPGPDGVYSYHPLSSASPAELRFLSELRDDVRCYRPRLVLIRASGYFQGCPPRFNMLDYLTHNGFVADALGSYRRLGRAGVFEVYGLESRGGSPGVSDAR